MAEPNFVRRVWERDGCAALVSEGPIRDLVYRRLIAQAIMLGWQADPLAGDEICWLSPLNQAA